ncbi:MAG: hypothetical protein RJA36_1465 [Pseudomonadota bacterium]|jgi:calcineurin-like phosphoesterase family protein
MTVFFTADTHFGHEALVRHGYRQFRDAAEVDALICHRWNLRVGPEDDVWHLGDFTMHGAEIAAKYLARVNGRIHLIWGNHDRNSVRKLPHWKSSTFAAEIRVDGQKLVLCHYAMEVWNNCHHGSLMLHGHSHGGLQDNSQRCDVGVDCWNFQPVTLAEIMERMNHAKPFRPTDHHRLAEDAQ